MLAAPEEIDIMFPSLMIFHYTAMTTLPLSEVRESQVPSRLISGV